MFRRKRSSSHQPLSTPSSSAQSAASHAYLKSQPSSTSLSSAAAATALRSLTPTPQPVENVQTKRMLQRRASITSQPDLKAPLGTTSPPPQSLRRASSSSSMSNRTFRREQSPGRPVANSRSASGSLNDAPPPLPAMPPDYAPRKQASGRSLSMGPPARVTSPPPRQQGHHARGMSVDRGVRRSPPMSPSLGTVPELERSTSRNSINFSYPMNARPNSSTPPPSSPNRRPRPVSASLAQQVSSESPRAPGPSPPPQQQQQQQQVTNSPAKITKTRRHFSTGTVGPAQPSVGTAVAAAQAAIIPNVTAPRVHAPAPSRPVIVKRPSVVPEDSQAEVRAEAGGSLKNNNNNANANANANNNATTTRTVKQSPPVEQSRILPIRATVTPEPQIIRSPPTPERINKQLLDHQPVIASPESNRSVDLGVGDPAKSHARQPSSSPGRSTRFSSQLSVTANELQLHHPPPRSVSPVKSAMKHTSQGSLSPDRIPGSIARPGPSSELSDGTSVTSDDGVRLGGAKRKSVAKVSFDDEAEIVGVAASPPTSPEDMFPESPPGRSKSKITWFGVGKKKPTPLDNADEFDEVLKPRRALPSFGSIRAPAAAGAAGAVRDGEIPEPTREEEHTDNESLTSSDSNHNMVVPGWSFANDHAIGGILASAQPQEEEAPKLTETIDHPPLPMPSSPPGPEESPTTSADWANEYISELPPGWVEGMQSAHFTAQPKPEPEATTVAPPPPPPPPATANDSSVAVQPSHELEKGRSSLEGYDVPGGFPRSSLELDPRTMSGGKSKRRSRDSAGFGSSAPDESGMPTTNGKGPDDASDSDSVYSDAAEDFDGDGFGSINAIVGGQTEQASRAGKGVDRTRPPAAREELPSVPEDETIGRAVSPPLDSGLPWVPDSPDTVDEPLPLSSPYPPFPLENPRPSSKVTRSNTKAASRTKRPVSVGGVPERVSSGQGIIPRNSTTSTTGSNTSALRQKTDPERRRPVSLGPILTNGNQSQDSPQRRPTTSDGINGFARPENRSTGSPGPGGKGHSMQRTMRAAGTSTQDSKVRFSSSTPTSPEDARPMSSGSGTGGLTMRTTLRGGPSRGANGNGNGNKATTFFSTGKSTSKSPTRKKLSRAPGPLFSSRFDDSDDDDDDSADDRVRNFHSRFADSSDEEEPGANNNTTSLRPVRGIPRRQGKEDGESTELEDSSDEEARRARSAAGTTGPTTRTKPSTSTSTSNHIKNNNAGTSGLAAVARSRGVSHAELEDFLHQRPSRKSGIFSRLNLRKSKNPEPKQLRKSTAETGAAAAPKDPVLHHRGGSVTTTVTANGKANGRGNGWGSNTRHLGGEGAEDGGGWPLRSNRKADEEAVAAETKPSAVINEGDEAAERSTPGGTTRVERDDSAVAAAGVAGDGAPAPTPAADRLAGEGSHFPRRDKDNNNNNNNNKDHSISARDVVIAGSGRKRRFPKLRRAFGLR